MNRINDQRCAEAVAAGLERIPSGIHRWLTDVDVLGGVDPIFAGFHQGWASKSGSSYRVTAHVVFPFHLRLPAAHRRTTMVLPCPEEWEPWIVVHELGHVLHHRLGFEHDAVPVTAYARTDRWEAFAEAFRCWVDSLSDASEAEAIRMVAPESVALFEALAAS